MLFFFIFLTFICGIISANSFSLLIGGFFILFFCGFLLFCFKNPLSKILTCLLFFVMGFYLTNISIHTRISSFETLQNITNNFSDTVTISGIIEKNPYNSDFRRTFRLKIDTLANSSTEYSFGKNENIGIFIQVPKNLTLNIGDKITFKTKLKENIDSKITHFYDIVGYTNLMHKRI